MLSFWNKTGMASLYRKTSKHIKMQTLQKQVTPVTVASKSSPVAPGKTSFLVFKYNKYFIVPTDNIAFFYVKHETSSIVCFDQQEYYVNHSLETIQNLVTDKQFYRLNRQYLINFNAVKEVEHYFARKLLVNLVVPSKDYLLVSKEKVAGFLHWLDNR
jgi:two-component system, LytTR family, response regulator LytT